MKTRFSALLLLTLSSYIIAGSAQAVPPPTPVSHSNSQTKHPTQTGESSYVTMMEIKTDIAERNYLSDPKIENLSEFVGDAQELLAASCLSDLVRTLQYPGFPEAQNCRAQIKKILEIDGANPIAQCAQNGIDSSQCREASEQVKLGAYNVGNGTWMLDDKTKSGSISQLDLQTALAEKSNHKEMQTLEDQVKSAASELHQHPHQREYIEALETKLQHLLKVDCVDAKLVLEAPTTAAASPTKTSKSGSEGGGGLLQNSNSGLLGSPKGGGPLQKTDSSAESDDPFARVLSSMDKTSKPAPAPTPTRVSFAGSAYYHYRLLPVGCFREIKFAENLLPHSPVVLCYRDGGTAPSCIDARRHEATAKAKHLNTQKSDVNPIGSF